MEIDARGLACPEPVMKTKTAVDTHSPASVRVITDNPASQQNVERFLSSAGYETRLTQEGADYLTLGSRDKAPEMDAALEKRAFSGGKKILVFCATDRMGFGDDALGKKLMASFIKTLKEMGPELWRLVFVNNGVKLSVDGSQVLEDLKAYEADGIKILVCGTCLTHFGLLEAKQVGETTNMLDIVTAMQLADSVIKI